jgi:hypothetical protein
MCTEGDSPPAERGPSLLIDHGVLLKEVCGMDPAELNLTTQITGYQRFLFVRLQPARVDGDLVRAMERLGDGLENMHDLTGPPTEESWNRGRLQLLRAESHLSQERDLPHRALSDANALVRLEGAFSEPLVSYEKDLRELLAPHGGVVETLTGVQRPRSYTSYAMTQFAYGPALPPMPGSQCPLGVVTPMNKSAAWWAMDWMHRESFFLPRYDTQERLIAKGHAQVAAAGIPCITRRLIHAAGGYQQEGVYDFVGYFEFAEVDSPIFRQVMAALRNVGQNPEWAYVQEGPEWWGRRVGRAAELWLRS